MMSYLASVSGAEIAVNGACDADCVADCSQALQARSAAVAREAFEDLMQCHEDCEQTGT